MNKLKEHTVRMTLSMSAEFYDYLQELADIEYLKVNIFVKQLIMKSVLDGHYAKDNPMFKEIEDEVNLKFDFKSQIIGKKKKKHYVQTLQSQIKTGNLWKTPAKETA